MYCQFKRGCRFRMNDFSSSFWVNDPRWRTPIGEQPTSQSPTENSFGLLIPPWSKEAIDDTGSPRNPFKHRVPSSEVCGEWDDESSHFRLFRSQMGAFLFHRHSANKWSNTPIAGLFLFMKKKGRTVCNPDLVFIWPCIWSRPPSSRMPFWPAVSLEMRLFSRIQEKMLRHWNLHWRDLSVHASRCAIPLLLIKALYSRELTGTKKGCLPKHPSLKQ